MEGKPSVIFLLSNLAKLSAGVNTPLRSPQGENLSTRDIEVLELVSDYESQNRLIQFSPLRHHYNLTFGVMAGDLGQGVSGTIQGVGFADVYFEGSGLG